MISPFKMVWVFLCFFVILESIQCTKISDVKVLVPTSQCLKIHGVTINSVTGVAYAACSGGVATIISISPKVGSANPTVATVASSSQCPGARSVSVDSATGFVYAICTGNNPGVISIDTKSSNVPIKTLITASRCSNPRSISIDSITGVVYATCAGSAVSVISANTIGNINSDVTTITTQSQCSSPYSIAVDSSTHSGNRGGFLYVVCGDMDPKVISINIGDVGDIKIIIVPTVSLCRNPYNIAVNHVTGTAYVTCSGSGIIGITSCIDKDNFGVSPYGRNTLSECQNPLSIFVNSITGIVYVICVKAGPSNVIIRIEANDTDVTTINTHSKCQKPLDISVDIVTNTVYIACSIGDTSVISILQPSCPPGSEFNKITGTCDMCNIGTYSNGGVKCHPPPSNTYAPLPGCSVPLACPVETLREEMSCSDGFAYAKEGYWLYTSNSITGEVKVLPCPKGLCMGGTVYGNQCAPLRLQNSSNILCHKCAENYAVLRGKCYPCEALNLKSVFLVIFFGFTFVGVIHYLSQSEDPINLSIFFYFVQTGSIMCGDNTETLISWFHIFNFKPQEAIDSCLIPLNPYQKIKMDIAIPYLYFIGLLFVMTIHCCFNHCFRRLMLAKTRQYRFSHPKSHLERFAMLVNFEKERYIRTFNTLYLASFSTVLILTLRYMYCIGVEMESKPTFFLYFNPAVNCDNREYEPWFMFTIFVLYLIPVIAVAAYLYYKYCKTSNNHSGKLSTRRYDLLRGPFSPKTFYLQTFILGRRLLVGIIATILAARPIDMYLSFALLHGILCIVHDYVNPYGNIRSDDIETASLFLLTLLSCFLAAYPPTSFSGAATGIILTLYAIPSILMMLGATRLYLSGRIPRFCGERTHNKRSQKRSTRR